MPVGIHGGAALNMPGKAIATYSQRLDQLYKAIHGHEHPMTACAVLEWKGLEGGFKKMVAANRAWMACICQHQHAVRLRRRNKFAAAIIAGVDSPLQIGPQRCTAVLTLHFPHCISRGAVCATLSAGISTFRQR